ncbi:UNVERIFIED_CONTAM: hypothetical protein FKN15_057183 [Acipenser sinensis]
MMKDLPTGGASVTSIRVLIAGEMTSYHVETPDDSIRGISSGDQISQKEASVLKTEEETATLECTFSTSSTRYWLHWYRQYPGTAPQFILFSGSGSFTADYAKERFSSTADKSSGLTTFTISNLQKYQSLHCISSCY